MTSNTSLPRLKLSSDLARDPISLVLFVGIIEASPSVERWTRPGTASLGCLQRFAGNLSLSHHNRSAQQAP